MNTRDVRQRVSVERVTPGWYVCDFDGFPQWGPFDTEAAAAADNLVGHPLSGNGVVQVKACCECDAPFLPFPEHPRRIRCVACQVASDF